MMSSLQGLFNVMNINHCDNDEIDTDDQCLDNSDEDQRIFVVVKQRDEELKG